MSEQQPGGHQPVRVRPHRLAGRYPSRRQGLTMLAGLLALAGVSAIIVAVTNQHHAPHPSRQAATAPLPSSSAVLQQQRPPSSTRHQVPKPTVTSKPNLPPLQSGLSLASSQPIRLSIPAINVNTSLMTLGLNADGTVQTPPLSRNSVAGWYELSATPGTQGSSVILGHIDSAAFGPGVFFRLGALNPGDHVDVQRADGITAVFRIDRVAEYPKTQFPSALVYGHTSYPALRLITCGGSFDSSSGNYRDNIIAFASLATSYPT